MTLEQKRYDFIKMAKSYLDDYFNSKDIRDLENAKGWINALEKVEFGNEQATYSKK